jgi:hypothetical protein
MSQPTPQGPNVLGLKERVGLIECAPLGVGQNVSIITGRFVPRRCSTKHLVGHQSARGGAADNRAPSEAPIPAAMTGTGKEQLVVERLDGVKEIVIVLAILPRFPRPQKLGVVLEIGHFEAPRDRASSIALCHLQQVRNVDGHLLAGELAIRTASRQLFDGRTVDKAQQHVVAIVLGIVAIEVIHVVQHSSFAVGLPVCETEVRFGVVPDYFTEPYPNLLHLVYIHQKRLAKQIMQFRPICVGSVSITQHHTQETRTIEIVMGCFASAAWIGPSGLN